MLDVGVGVAVVQCLVEGIEVGDATDVGTVGAMITRKGRGQVIRAVAIGVVAGECQARVIQVAGTNRNVDSVVIAVGVSTAHVDGRKLRIESVGVWRRR